MDYFGIGMWGRAINSVEAQSDGSGIGDTTGDRHPDVSITLSNLASLIKTSFAMRRLNPIFWRLRRLTEIDAYVSNLALSRNTNM